MPKRKLSRADEMIDALLKEYGLSPEAVLGKGGLVKDLTKRVVERALAGELTHHLGYEKGQAPEEVTNYRNGYSGKTVQAGDGEMEIAVPRDREGSFEPILVRKRAEPV